MTRTINDEVILAARELGTGGRWQRAFSLLDTAIAQPNSQRDRTRLALAAADIAMERMWSCGDDGETKRRITTAGETTDHDTESGWDLGFLLLRRDYYDLILGSGTFRPGPDGKDPGALADLRRRCTELITQAPDQVRRGWAEFYLGTIADNLYSERDAAPEHYLNALEAGRAGDDLLTREAQRHLGDHDHDDGDQKLALERWQEAAACGARAGAVPGALSQQMLLALLAREAGDEAGARALAREIARWADAIGAVKIAAQANGFLAGTDPTAAAEDENR